MPHALVQNQPQRLELLHDIIVRCFEDRGKFRGKATTQEVSALRQCLRVYEGIQSVVNFFEQHK